jgi:DNA adenine methylase
VAGRLVAHVPEHREYREAFAGGAAIFLRKPKVPVNWLNDLHPGLHAFFVAARDHYADFAALCREQTGDRREIFNRWVARKDLMVATGDQAIVERAVQYYYINRTVWGGRVVYDPTRRSRLYFSNAPGWDNLEKKLAHLERVSAKLQGVKVTMLPFEYCFEDAAEDTFFYLDPPYVRDSTASRTDKLYDKEFALEQHDLLARLVAKTKAKVMLSYEDTPEVRKLFHGSRWRIEELQWTYSGTYAVTREQKEQQQKEKKVRGNELLIMNY